MHDRQVQATCAKGRCGDVDDVVRGGVQLAGGVVIIDEAHLHGPDQLEELRLLTNAEMDSQSPFALLLVGQPALARQLRLGVFAALDQRIARGISWRQWT